MVGVPFNASDLISVTAYSFGAAPAAPQPWPAAGVSLIDPLSPCYSPMETVGARMQNRFFRLFDIWLYVRHPFLMLSYFRNMGYWPRPSLPRNYNEKMLWRRLFDHDPRLPQRIDKLRCKEHVREAFPDIRLPATLWQGSDPALIPAALLAGSCVVKANHGSGWNLLVHDGRFDRRQLTRKARKWMRRRYYGRGRMQWGYRDITPRLIVEEMVMHGGRPVDREYKCYMARDRCIYVYMKVDRFGENPLDVLFDPDGNSRITECSGRYFSVHHDRPGNWKAILAAAARMAREFDSVRVDLYETDGEIWFSEYTFYSEGGYDSIDWPKVVAQQGELWDLRRSWFLSTDHSGLRQIYRNRLKTHLDWSAPQGAQPARATKGG